MHESLQFVHLYLFFGTDWQNAVYFIDGIFIGSFLSIDVQILLSRALIRRWQYTLLLRSENLHPAGMTDPHGHLGLANPRTRAFNTCTYIFKRSSMNILEKKNEGR